VLKVHQWNSNLKMIGTSIQTSKQSVIGGKKDFDCLFFSPDNDGTMELYDSKQTIKYNDTTTKLI
jgi:hypothetical protein